MGISIGEAEIDTLQNQLTLLQTEKPDGWQEKAVRLIRKSRFEGPDLEWNRLKDWGVIDADLEERIEKTVQAFHSHLDLTKMMLGRALEMQKIYGDTHHVFIHAQSSKWLVFPHLVKEFMKIHCPEKDLHQFKFLRLPNLSRDYDISRYSKAADVYDHEPVANEDLISCDGYFYNTGGYESALDFMARNSNIMSSSSKVIQGAIQFFYPKARQDRLQEYVTRFKNLTLDDTSKIGHLFVFCIPKEKSPDIQYRAHPFGIPCTCHGKEGDSEILESLQKGELTEETKCSYNQTPQFRIFTPEVKKENGVKIYLIPSDKTYSKQLKDKVRNLVQEIHSNMDEAESIRGKIKKLLPASVKNNIPTMCRLSFFCVASVAIGVRMAGKVASLSRGEYFFDSAP